MAGCGVSLCALQCACVLLLRTVAVVVCSEEGWPLGASKVNVYELHVRVLLGNPKTLETGRRVTCSNPSWSPEK